MTNAEIGQGGKSRSGFPLGGKITVFCDFDGPVMDVSNRYYSTYELALTQTKALYKQQGVELLLEPLTQERFWSMKQNRIPDAEIAWGSGLRGEQVEVFLQQVRAIVNQPQLLEKDRLQPGVKWTLSLLHSRGVRLVLVTLREQNQVTQILQNHGLARLFSAVWGTQDSGAAYNNYAEVKTQLLQAAIAQEKIAKESSYMVGDTEADILAGKACGVETIALTCGLRSRSYLEQFNPSHIINDLLSAGHYLLRQNQVVAVSCN